MSYEDNLRLAYGYGVKLALAEKKFGPFTFKIDRPKGYVKTWKRPDGSEKKYTYPVDYGYLIRHTGEDGEGLDFFVGDDPSAPVESFMKLKPGPGGKLIEDETKFMIGLTESERKKVLALYDSGELKNHRVYKTVYDLVDRLKDFKNKKRTT
jgi:inorganic pyrophosphatase